ncbi:TPA: DarT ssDNA thymidine ADP-ribosyltransferase family protein [Clostridioides difficile]
MFATVQNPIKDFIESCNINSLIHFTKLENLPSILKNGLVSRQQLDSEGIDYLFNDEYRMDGKYNSICLSISFPNYRMFYKYSKSNRDKWCIIFLNPSILYEKNCLFCIENAASTNETNRSDSEKKGINGLKKLFEDIPYRSKVNLPSHFTTNSQAEVLVLENIEPKYIQYICVNHRNVKFNHEDYSDFKFYYGKTYDGFFSPRYDYENGR